MQVTYICVYVKELAHMIYRLRSPMTFSLKNSIIQSMSKCLRPRNIEPIWGRRTPSSSPSSQAGIRDSRPPSSQVFGTLLRPTSHWRWKSTLLSLQIQMLVLSRNIPHIPRMSQPTSPIKLVPTTTEIRQHNLMFQVLFHIYILLCF